MFSSKYSMLAYQGRSPAVSSQPNWAADYAVWTAAFRKATGTPLAFLHLDVSWGDPRLNTGS